MGKQIRPKPEVPRGHKYCPRCKTIRPHDEWHRARRTKDGYSSHCSLCRVDGARRTHLKRMYGLTPEGVAAMVQAQGGKCAICRERPAVHVDRDHKTGRVRGMTCFPCNGALGQFKENVEWLGNAIAYLEMHRSGSERPFVREPGQMQFHRFPDSPAEAHFRRLVKCTATESRTPDGEPV